MRLSSRLRWGLEPNPLARLIAEKRVGGVEVLDLTESNPTRAGLEYPAAEILGAFDDPGLLRYEPVAEGLLAAREAIASAEYGGAVDPARILLTASTSEAYSFLFKLLCDPGDEVLAPHPSYPLFEFLAELESVRIAPYALEYHGAWEIEWHSVLRALSPRTRAVVLVNPNNPTGSYLKQEELTRLIEICRERDLAILSDEVFAPYSFGEDRRRVGTLTGVTDVLTFAVGGLSKAAGLPQMKLGWIVTGGPESLVRQAREGLELIADTYLSAGTPVQCAAGKLLAAGRKVREEIQSRTARNLEHLIACVETEPALRVLTAEGGWNAVLQIPLVRTEEEWALHLLREHDVVVQPGYFYDFRREGFLVLSLLTAPAVFDAGAERILTALR